LVGQPSAGRLLDQYGHEVSNRAVVELVVFAVNRLAHLVRRQFRESASQPGRDRADRVLFGQLVTRSMDHRVNPSEPISNSRGHLL